MEHTKQQYSVVYFKYNFISPDSQCTLKILHLYYSIDIVLLLIKYWNVML